MGDPFAALARIIVGYHDAGIVQGWLRLLFSIGFSFFLTFCSVSGTAWAAEASWRRGFGLGLISASALAFVAYRNASQKLIKGTIVAVPQSVLEDQFNKDTGQGPNITRPKE